MLHGAIFLAKMSRNVGTINPLQVAEIMLNGAILNCNLQWFENLMQSLQKVKTELPSLYNRCKPKQVARHVAKRSCYTLKPITLAVHCKSLKTY